MDDGQFVRDLGELGQALCEADAGRLKTILADSKTARRIERELEVVLPFYLPLLADSINRRGEETHLTSDELATLLVSHGTEGIVLKPKLLLESGRFGFALMQAAAALAELLQRFPQAHFTELDPGRYTVTTDAATAERLAQQPQWRAAMAA